MKKIICVLLALMCVISAFSVSPTIFAADESAYKAEFTLTADNTKNISKDETIVVRVKLKTNYKIYVVGLPVIYDSTKFELLDTSSSNIKSFLTFYGTMASSYVTNGNWKSPAELYTKRNSNTSYWSQSSVMNKYKIVTATWTADSTKSNTPVTLSSDTVIVSFKLKAKSAVSAITNSDIFISDDFKKTSSFAGGVWYVGRCAGNYISEASFVAVGQTLTAKSTFTSLTPGKTVNESIDLQYRSSVDLMKYLDGFDSSKCSFTTSDSSIVSLKGSTATGEKRGSATVTVTQTGSSNKATINISVSYAWWQWIIKILLFGWIWY